MENEEGAKGRTLYLTLKPVYMQMILHGYKTSEFREVKDYYNKLLVEEESVDTPKDIKKWTRCIDGVYRKFKHYDTVHFKAEGMGTAEYVITGIDCGFMTYVIRLGKQTARTPQ